jgi:glycosyltransferase involved in cell wall biosynthesis
MVSNTVSRRRMLYICHNHASVMPGGVETYVSELYDAMRHSPEFEPFLMARLGIASPDGFYSHSGTPFRPIGNDPCQYFFETSGFDTFYLTLHDKDVYSRFFHEFLLAVQPDLVHFQHAVHMGYDLILQARKTLPHAPIIMTLQEYLPICHNSGQMVRTYDRELCRSASPRRCHECFPQIAPQEFFARKRFLQTYLSLVDLFLAPSRFLLERYVEWGIPREKIRYEDYGRLPVEAVVTPPKERPRNRIGYFGQFNPFKGVDVLLKAMKILAEDQANTPPQVLPAESYQPSSVRRAHLWLHGSNLEMHPEEFQDEFKILVESAKSNVTLTGRYDRNDLPQLMAATDWVVVPSIWWENSPLVIQEAFLYGRPVICSDIGALAEKVSHDVNGLHFRRDDPHSLAETIREAVSTPGLWEKLRAGIPKVHSIKDHVEVLTEIYLAALRGRKASP